MTSAQHIARLLYKELQGELSDPEFQELAAWKAANPEHSDLQESLGDEEKLTELIRLHHPENKEKVRLNIEGKMAGQLRFNVVPLYRRPFFQVAVAASVLLVIGLGSYLMFFNKKQPATDPIAVTTDVKAPETNRAMITLADGRTVYLDSAANGELVQQGNIKIVKLDNGQIAYQTASSSLVEGGELKYNTLSNPRGSKVIDMAFSDGSHVWLNAGSSVTYPVAFLGNERNVSITGEAYFEVAPDKTKPFTVSKGDMKVAVLGTHFNVNAYEDENDIKVTLLEGSVKVTKDQHSLTLQPRQQAVISSTISLNTEVDIEQVMAWKNGKFDFGEGTSVQEIMRQVARWYDVEVLYNGPSNQQFWGSVSREVNVSKVLEKFELTGRIKFKVENKKIIVNP